jgi:transcriptional regulator with XRE-family HTH domain
MTASNDVEGRGLYGNQVSAIRSQKGLTRSALAAALGTTPYEIERIEAGETVRYDTLVRLAGELGTTPAELSPAARDLFAKLEEHGDLRVLDTGEVRDAFDEVGIDVSPERWSLKLRLRGGAVVVYPISSHDRNRFFSSIQDTGKSGVRFFVAHSTSCAFAVNLDCVTFAHFLFDAPGRGGGPEVAEIARVFVGGARSPLFFDVNPDEGDERDGAPLQDLLAELDLHVERNDFVWLDDVDGERAMFRAQTLALLELPLWAVVQMNIDDEIVSATPAPTNDEARGADR